MNPVCHKSGFTRDDCPYQVNRICRYEELVEGDYDGYTQLCRNAFRACPSEEEIAQRCLQLSGKWRA